MFSKTSFLPKLENSLAYKSSFIE